MNKSYCTTCGNIFLSPSCCSYISDSKKIKCGTNGCHNLTQRLSGLCLYHDHKDISKKFETIQAKVKADRIKLAEISNYKQLDKVISSIKALMESK